MERKVELAVRRSGDRRRQSALARKVRRDHIQSPKSENTGKPMGREDMAFLDTTTKVRIEPRCTFFSKKKKQIREEEATHEK